MFVRFEYLGELLCMVSGSHDKEDSCLLYDRVCMYTLEHW